MSNILKGLNEGRSSWDSNMPGYQGDYGGAENWGRRNKASDENQKIDAMLAQQHVQRQEYEKSGKFWLKLKDSQRHLPAGPFTGKQAANTAALELLKQQPELKGNLVITAYGPDETQGIAEGGDVPHWRVEQSEATGRYYVVTGYTSKSRRVWKSKQGAGDFSKRADAEAKAQELNQGVAEGQLDELSPQTLASYKKKAGADASAADKAGDYARGHKRFKGIVRATKKEFDNDAKGVKEGENKQVKGGDPCWSGYEMVGKKKKNGKSVPNCVPVKESAIMKGIKND